MSYPLQISFRPYDIVRLPGRGASPSPEGPGRYVLRRPDGSACCEGVTWPDVERAIERDERARGASAAESRARSRHFTTEKTEVTEKAMVSEAASKLVLSSSPLPLVLLLRELRELRGQPVFSVSSWRTSSGRAHFVFVFKI